jgi:hypothetical protein
LHALILEGGFDRDGQFYFLPIHDTARLTQLIPPWGVRYIHYYGLYSSRCKARWPRLPHIARVAPQGWHQSHAQPMSSQAPEATEPTTVSHAAYRSAWARLIAKVYEVESVALSPVGLPDETHRSHHRPR